jgi:hypothetical protein
MPPAKRFHVCVAQSIERRQIFLAVAPQGADRRLDAIKMCADCRVIAVTEAEMGAAGGTPRADARTTEDYLREREERERKG